MMYNILFTIITIVWITGDSRCTNSDWSLVLSSLRTKTGFAHWIDFERVPILFVVAYFALVLFLFCWLNHHIMTLTSVVPRNSQSLSLLFTGVECYSPSPGMFVIHKIVTVTVPVYICSSQKCSQCLVCSWECYGPRPRIVVQKSVTVSAYIPSSHECTADECSVYKSVIVIVPAYISSSHECTALICSVHKSVTVIVPVYISSSHECTALVCSVHKSVMDPVPELLFTRVLQSQCTFFLHMNAQVLSVLFTRMLWTPSQNGCCSQECHSYSIYLLLMKVLLTQSQNVCCWQVLQSQYVCCSQECVWVSHDICCLRKFYSASIFLLTGALLSQYILLFTRMLQSHVAVPVYLSFTRVKKSEYILHKCYIPVCLLFSSQKRYSLVYLSFTRVLESQYILHKCSPVCLLFSSQKRYSLMYLSFTRVLAVFVVHMTAC